MLLKMIDGGDWKAGEGKAGQGKGQCPEQEV